MATLYISEYAELARPEPGLGQMAKGKLIAKQTVTITGASTQSATFNSSTKFIRLCADAICSFLIDTNPTVTTADARMPQDSVEYFGVNPNEKVAVISNV